MLHEDIKSSVKEAMLAKNEVRLRTVRGILAAFTNELVATKHKPQEMLADEDCLNVIRRLVKQREDSIEQFAKGNRPDLVKSEEAEMKILDAYLPKLMSQDEIRPFAEKKMKELGIVPGQPSLTAGKLTGMLMKDLKGKADGADVKAVVDDLFK